MDASLILILILLTLSGLFSGSEVALTSLSRIKMRTIQGDGRFGSRAILKLKEHPQRSLISILLSNQAVNVLASVTATLWGLRLFGQERIGWVTLGLTIALIFLGTLVPKVVAMRFPEPFARAVSYPLLLLLVIIRPAVWIVEGIIQLLLKLLKADRESLDIPSHQELEAMLDISAEEGVLAEEEESFMKQILNFGQTKVQDIMVLLKDIEAVDMESPKEELERFFMEHQKTHYPVYHDDRNNVKGILTAHDLMQKVFRSKKSRPLLHHKFSAPIVVPKTASLTELFKEFKDKKRRMAVVVDEHGQTVGLVSLSNILEEITGIRMKPEEEKWEPKIEKTEHGAWEADGEITVAKINEALKVKLPYPEHETLGLVILERLKRFPEPEEKIDLEGMEAEMIRVEKNLIRKVRVRKKRPGKKQ